VPRLPWPLPALLAWTLAWLAYRGLLTLGLAAPAALVAAAVVGLAMSFFGHSWWRRLMIAAGFPLVVLAMGAAVWPAWSWLVLLAVLAAVYPLHAWRDAPLFPTPAGALRTLPRHASMPRALHKAAAQMRPGSWLVSLEFEATGAVAAHVIRLPDGRSIWIYQCPVMAVQSQRS
jgi:hypothetical protein